ncbi:MAG: TatD family hydrolase [Treponema sp.]|nr:TatD family hydrolase [Treponema sp.]
MFSDTHFHFRTMLEETPELDGQEVLSLLAKRNFAFGLDIGTEPEDLLERQFLFDKVISQITDYKIAEKVRNYIYFSAGIWPEVEYIHNAVESVKKLENQIQLAAAEPDKDTLHRNIIAIGECGIDHHWNPSGVDGRSENDFDEKTYRSEKDLFCLQLELGKRLNLPVIVHSRDGFQDTLDCINEVGYNKGIIHCYSYGLEEARAFVDLGWYISFSGGVTYTKKSKLEDMTKLLNFVPEDRLLCETDAPYLAPTPFRGNPNTPVLVEHTYNYVAAARKIEPQKLSELVDKNIKDLFFAK